MPPEELRFKGGWGKEKKKRGFFVAWALHAMEELKFKAKKGEKRSTSVA